MSNFAIMGLPTINIRNANRSSAPIGAGGNFAIMADPGIIRYDSDGTPIIPEGTMDISGNGVYNVRTYAKINVEVVPRLQNKVTTENGIVVADNGYDGLASVTVDVTGGTSLGVKTITLNGTYYASTDGYDGFSEVRVNVPTSGDVGTKYITSNGTYYSSSEGYDGYWEVKVNVPTDEKILAIKTIEANGTYDASSDSLDGYSEVIVNVPNTYTQSDEGKVVSNGELVAQTTQTYTANGTYDTTTVSSVTVALPVAAGVSF